MTRRGGRCGIGHLAVAAPFALALLAQPVPPGARNLTFRSSADGSEQPYALYLPRNFDAGRKYPLVVSLHAEETNHSVNIAQALGVSGTPFELAVGLRNGYARAPEVEFIVASPFARGTMGYRGIAERDVYDMLAEVERLYPVDADRVYLTGISMGGAGALWYALTRPDVWAAVAPLCAAPVPGAEELAPNALNLPVRLFHGELDPAAPPAASRAWQRRLLDAGDPAEYVEYPTVRHNVWEAAYRGRGLFDWFAAHRRNPMPERVRLVARSYEYASAYWLRIDEIAPGALGSVDARIAGKAEARVETHDVAAFHLAGAPLTLPAVVTIDGTPVRVRAGGSLSFVKTDGRWREGRPAAGGKSPEAGGPIAAAVAVAHIYVYGTADAPPPEVVEERRQAAERASDWSSPPYARARVKFAVKADSEVTGEDIANCNLVLFGASRTNSLIARFGAGWPLELKPGAADYGLLFIAPLGRRYALVSSGLPWWTGAAAANRAGGDPFAPPALRLLETFGDFILFKGSLGTVVAEGDFDRAWKVPPAASAAMASTGTVNVSR
jgi:poly(3-hydroxybutyrate) depolymerase